MMLIAECDEHLMMTKCSGLNSNMTYCQPGVAAIQQGNSKLVPGRVLQRIRPIVPYSRDDAIYNTYMPDLSNYVNAAAGPPLPAKDPTISLARRCIPIQCISRVSSFSAVKQLAEAQVPMRLCHGWEKVYTTKAV